MDLTALVLDVLPLSGTVMTVEEVSEAVRERLKSDIKSVLNSLHKAGTIESVHGGGGWRSVYGKPNFLRRL